MKRYVLASLLMHCALLFAFIFGASNLPEQQEQLGAPESMDVEVIEQQEAGQSVQEQGPGEPNKDKKCISDKWYGGIGISINLFSGEILEIFKGYSAESAGLQVGDIILNYGQVEITGEPGEDVMLQIETLNGKLLTKMVTRVKVCIWGQQKEEP